ncbi:MAG: NAD(P)-dependent oxidoreductase [Oligoflexia bacterium]|nr:NAD(P)-dependent oxidoreductase [Oligoflexia bacterium]
MLGLQRDLDEVIQRGKEDWLKLRGKSIFITGGTGFFGKWLLASLCEAQRRFDLGISITALSRNPHAFLEKYPAFSQPCLSFIPGDVLNFPYPEKKFDLGIHAAVEASAALNLDHPLQMLETNISGTRRVMEFFGKASVKRVLFVSSGAVYGPQPPEIPLLSEGYSGAPSPLNPANAYAEGKRAAELYSALISRARGFELVVARCFAFVGPFLPLDTHFAVGNFIRDALAGKEIVIKGDGTPIRSYLYASDLVLWLLGVLTRGRNQTAYNVGSEESVTIEELANTLSQCFERPPVVRKEIPSAERPSGGGNRYLPSTKLAREQLGLQQWIPLHEALRRTIDWNQTQR